MHSNRNEIYYLDNRLDSVIVFIDPHFLIISDDIVDAKMDGLSIHICLGSADTSVWSRQTYSSILKPRSQYVLHTYSFVCALNIFR